MTCEGNLWRSPKYLWFVFPDFGPFPMCRIDYVARVQGYAALLIIQTGKVVEVVVALAYVLASRFADTRRRRLFVEEVEALGEVLADLADDRPAQPQQEMEKSSRRHHVGEETAESTSSWGGDARNKITNLTNVLSQLDLLCGWARWTTNVGQLWLSVLLNTLLSTGTLWVTVSTHLCPTSSRTSPVNQSCCFLLGKRLSDTFFMVKLIKGQSSIK